MATAVTNRKQRLRTLENEIRSGMEKFYYVAMKLKEIRDEELYTEDGFSTWKEYLRKTWDYSDKYVWQMIQSAEYREKLPSSSNEEVKWTEGSVRQLTRIPDKRQAARVAAKVVKAVEHSEKQAAKNPEVKPIKLTSSIVKKFVDEDLGVKQNSRPKATAPEYKDDPNSLHNYLRSKTGVIEGITENLAAVPADAWERLADEYPDLAECLATACDELAELLRS